MNLTYQLTDTGYVILRDGVAWVEQPFDPALPGFVPMSAERATETAEAEIARLQAEHAAAAEQPQT